MKRTKRKKPSYRFLLGTTKHIARPLFGTRTGKTAFCISHETGPVRGPFLNLANVVLVEDFLKLLFLFRLPALFTRLSKSLEFRIG